MQGRTINNSKPRVIFISIVIIAVAVLIIVRLFYVQIVHGDEFRDNADAQYTARSNLVENRGTIYFQKKNGQLISAASQATGYKISLTPDSISDPEEAYRLLSTVLAVDKEDFISKASKKGDPYEELNTHLTEEMADSIEELAISGIKLAKNRWRVYPANTLASQTIGFVAFKGDDLSGRYGLERYYNDVLERANNSQFANFFVEIFSDIESNFANNAQEGDIVTTIEPSVQAELENQLQAVSKKWNAEMAGGIIMNPKTGEIYAMGKTPTFDLNDFKSVGDARDFGNPFVENIYEFGSVIKPLVMASAIDAGVVTPETTYFDKGFIKVKDRTINNFDKKGRGTATMQDVLSQSLNTGMVFAEQKLGKELFKKYMLSFGINERTGIDLPNETQGLASNIIKGNEVEYANAAFGQGIAFTPVGAIRAFSAIPNGGKMVNPHLAQSIVLSSGLTEKIPLKEPTTVFSEETANTLSNMMVTIVDTAMGGGIHKMEHYSIAGKTGTAQIAKESGGGYYEDKYLHSFFGFFPASDPKFLVFMFVRDPKGVNFASQTLIEPFFATAKFLLNYYNIQPDR